MAERKKVKKISPKQRVKYKPPVDKIQNKKVDKRVSRALNNKDALKSAPKQIKMTPEVRSEVFERKSDVTQHRTQPKKSFKNIQTAKQRTNQNKKTVTKKTPTSNRPLSVVRGKKSFTGPNLSVVLGNKLKAQRKRLVYYIISLIIIGSVLVFSAVSPTGPIEKITNSFALLGGGKNPASLNGTSVKSVKTANDKIFVLTDSHLDCFTKTGNEFLSYQHNFSNPVLEVSSERSLVYNRESTSFIVANNSDKIFEKNLEFSIFCADISDSGSVAFATKSSGYAAQVQVFAKNMKQTFSWYLVDGLISDIALSNNGKYLAVSVLKVNNGAFNSSIYCFKTDSEQPIFTIEKTKEPIVSLETISKNYFSFVSQNGVSFVNFKNGTVQKDDADASLPTYLKADKKGALAVFGNTSNVEIVRFNKKGEKVFEFVHNGLIDDIAYSNGIVYIMRSNSIFSYDTEGNEIKTVVLEQKPQHIVSIDKKVFVVDNLNLSKHE